MGSPKSGGSNIVDQISRGVEYGARDIGAGLTDIAKGQVSRGISGYLAGTAELYTGGMAPALGPGEVTKGYIKDTANEQAAQDQAAADGMEKKAKLDKIQNRLSEEVRLRQKTPGKAQTLLTSSLTPSSTSTGTLLTGRG